jgi:soluble lytic murein transglycosylase-like protein
MQQQAIAQQRLSVQKQLGAAAQQGFFVLPPPSGVTRYSVPMTNCDPLPSAEVDSLVTTAATAQSLNPDLLRAVIRQESGFRPCAVSSKGALGLMQLMPATAEQFGIKEPFDPRRNVEGGARLLKELLTRYGGDLARALGAYNAGPAAVDASEGVPAIRETVDYVKQILSRLPAKE